MGKAPREHADDGCRHPVHKYGRLLTQLIRVQPGDDAKQENAERRNEIAGAFPYVFALAAGTGFRLAVARRKRHARQRWT